MELWQAILLALGGNATLLLVLGFLGRSLIQIWLAKDIKKFEDYLAREAKSFELELKAKSDLEIERLKASFVRASRVHKRQLDILSKLNRFLLEAQTNFQGMTASARFSGEPSRGEYESQAVAAMEGARETLLNSSLFLPKPLVEKCENAFRVFFEGRLDVSFARDPNLEPSERAKMLNAAAASAHMQLPQILQEIDTAARLVMHGKEA